MISNIVTACVGDIEAKLNATAAIEEYRILSVYDQTTLLDMSKELQYPAAGVMYEGLIPKSEAGHGQAPDIHVSILVLVGDKITESKGKLDKAPFTLILDKLRDAIKGSIAPTGHKWVFVMEVPLNASQKGLGYYQKWKVTAPLT